MKRINEYKKIFGISGEIQLKELKSTYRTLVKEWHPDKFQSDNEKLAEAEIMSQRIIDGYHFLVSIAPETKIAQQEEYTKTTMESGIEDFQHKSLLLEITFTDGNTYEYFGVPRSIYIKLIQSDKQVRFAKRSIYNSYLYRKSKKGAISEQN